MRLPAVPLAALFACGILVGLFPPVARQVSSRHFIIVLSSSFVLTACFLAAGIALCSVGRPRSAAATSLLSWILLGAVAALISEQPLRADHVTKLVTEGRLDLHAPLGWQGQLRDEPAQLPGGYGKSS